MGNRIRDHIRSNVVGYIALFCFAMGGTAYATHPGGANTISSGDIINGEVKTGDIADFEVRAGDIAPDSLGSGKIAERSVKNSDLGLGASSSNTIADGGIQGVDVKAETLTGAHIDESTLFNDSTLTGDDIAEHTLGRVPGAANAENATLLDGKDSTEFAPASSFHLPAWTVLPLSADQDPNDPPSTTGVLVAGPIAISAECGWRVIDVGGRLALEAYAQLVAQTTRSGSAALSGAYGGSPQAVNSFGPGDEVVVADVAVDNGIEPPEPVVGGFFHIAAPDNSTKVVDDRAVHGQFTVLPSTPGPQGPTDCVFVTSGMGSAVEPAAP